jgi:putative toxin-antitoxin system antitoxin component (TIGR02293 family)
MATIEKAAEPSRELRPNPRAQFEAMDFVALYRTEPMARIDLIKGGVPARTVGVMARQLDMSKERLMNLLGMAPATVNRKVKTGDPLGTDEGSRVVGVARLIGQVDDIVRQSGRSEKFDAALWMAGWIDRPVPALGDRRPAELLDTIEGQALVSEVIARMQSGAYS